MLATAAHTPACPPPGRMLLQPSSNTTRELPRPRQAANPRDCGDERMGIYLGVGERAKGRLTVVPGDLEKGGLQP